MKKEREKKPNLSKEMPLRIVGSAVVGSNMQSESSSVTERSSDHLSRVKIPQEEETGGLDVKKLLHLCGGSVLPENIESTKLAVGPFILKVDKIVNCGLPPRSYIFMTDGVGQRAVGIEDRPIEGLGVFPPPSHIVVSNVLVHREIISLTPESVVVLTEEQSNIHRAASTAENNLDQQMHIDNGAMLSDLPFTYFPQLFQNWAEKLELEGHHSPSPLQGKIKCLETQVKKIGYKYQQSKSKWEYEIVCSVHDYCYSSEILLHNDLVQKWIGHSADAVFSSSQEAEAALIKEDVTENMRCVPLFLTDFKGIMVVEMNTSSEYPLAIEVLHSPVF